MGYFKYFRKRIISILIVNEKIYSGCRFFYRSLMNLFNCCCLILWRGKSPDFNKYIYVQPDDIRFICKLKSNKFRDAGKVLDGDWDLDRFSFEDNCPYYKSIKQIINGREWRETPLFKKGLVYLSQGKSAYGCNYREELEKRGQRLLGLYENIKQQGYKLPPNKKYSTISDEISVHVGRNGEFVFHDGGHRLAIAKILGLETIPVQVTYRHAEWDRFRRFLFLEAKHAGGKLYQRIPHPDLDCLPYSHDCSERVDIITPHLPKNSGKLLDIGSNYGMFCHAMESMGFDCIAVEMDDIHYSTLVRVRDFYLKKFDTVKASILDLDMSRYGRFEVVFALNIFHHLIKSKSLYNKLVHFLKRLDAECIFFEPHKNEENAGIQYYKNFENEEFVDFVKKHTGLSSHLEIGQVSDGRSIYKVW